jgi:hypothetical protein
MLGGPVTIIANDDPPKPLGPNTNFTSLLMIAEKSFQRTDGETLQLYRVVPIYTDERELEISEGAPALIRAFDRRDAPFIVDLDRPSVARCIATTVCVYEGTSFPPIPIAEIEGERKLVLDYNGCQQRARIDTSMADFLATSCSIYAE